MDGREVVVPRARTKVGTPPAPATVPANLEWVICYPHCACTRWVADFTGCTGCTGTGCNCAGLLVRCIFAIARQRQMAPLDLPCATACRTRPVRPDVPSGPLLSPCFGPLSSLSLSPFLEPPSNSFTFFSALLDCFGQWGFFKRATLSSRLHTLACLPRVPRCDVCAQSLSPASKDASMCSLPAFQFCISLG